MVAYIFLESNQYSVGETQGKVSVALVRTGDLSEEVVIEYGTNASTATAGSDYVAKSGFVTMAAGESRVVVDIPIINDTRAEGTETFNFSLINTSSGTVLFPRTALIDILDDERPSVQQNEPALTPDYAVTLSPIIQNAGDPISVAFSPIAASTAYIALKSGVVEAIDTSTGAVLDVVLDISSEVNSRNDRGIMDIALHPDLANNPYLYAFYVVDPPDTAGNVGNAGPDGAGNRFAYLVRYTLDAANDYLSIVPGSDVVMLGGAGQTLADISGGGELNFTETAYADLPSSGLEAGSSQFKQDYIKVDSLSHAGGALAFGPDGALYVGVGDGTSYDYADPRSVEVQNVNSLSGKILRIDPLTGKGLADNPFVSPGADLDANSSKVYQLGLRNPFALAFDDNGRLFVSETGWFHYEEINTGGAGANFGWPYFEGGDNGVNLKTVAYRDFWSAAGFYQAVDNGSIKIAAPMRAFAHSESEPGYQVQAIVGSSSVYSGSVYPEAFQSDYFFTDVSQGEIFTVDVNDPRKTKYLGTLPTGFGPVNFTQGPDGYIYYCDLVTGSFGRIVISGLPNTYYDRAGASETLIGTVGAETFVVDGLSSKYQIVASSDRKGVTIQGGAFSDTLYDFETVKFVDKSVDLLTLAGNKIFATAGADIVDGINGIRGLTATVFADRIHGFGGDDTLSGLGGNDIIWGYEGKDSLFGGSHNDELYGGPGDDLLDGGTGNDRLFGGVGADVMVGGPGDDAYFIDLAVDQIVEKADEGFDTIVSPISLTLPENVESGWLTGLKALNLFGNELDNRIFGNSGANSLSGVAGRDMLCGCAGDDKLDGGAGMDHLIGGKGRDIFVFKTAGEIGNGKGYCDFIEDFAPGVDRIDLSALDANVSLVGDQSFSFIGSALLSGVAGQLNYYLVGSKAVVQGDMDGDAVADFSIVVWNFSTLSSPDFIL